MSGIEFSKLTVVSGAGQEFELHESIRSAVVFCRHDDGTKYELKTSAFRPDGGNKYLTVKLRFAKQSSVKSGVVDGSFISKLYKKSEASNNVNAARVREDSIPLEKARMEFINIINSAIAERSTDIHFIVREHGAKILFRVNGSIEPRNEFSFSPEYATGLLGAIYGETKDSTDPSFSPKARSACTIKYDNPPVSLRWQTVPLGDAHGTDFDVVLRVTKQDTSSLAAVVPLNKLGYLDWQVELLTAACNSRGGIFMAGETGSGKTTALRSLMAIVRGNGSTKIYSVEDPIELKIFGVSQINARGGSMGQIVKSLMRGDPDTVMVGEIRDAEVAEAMQDVIRSGHKALTSIHAPSAMGIIPRLSSKSLGIDRETIVEPGFVSCLVYQYLMPVMCDHCKIAVNDKPGSVEHIAEHLFGETRYALNRDNVFVKNDKGCEKCRKGISGMTICAETIRLTDEMAELIRDRRDTEALRQYRLQRTARFDSPDMTGKTAYESAIYKVSQGMIDPNDVNNMCGPMLLERIVRGTYA